MKTNILSLLAIAGLITFAGCASDDTANKQNEQEPGTEGLTSFVEEDQATRTTGEYDGSGLNFYWTAGDRLWVNTGTAISPVLKRDRKNNISDLLVANPAIPTGVKRAAKAKFWFRGTFTASSYPVRYTGKNGTKDKVKIKASQSQTIPNDASHIGEDGDFAVATATKPVGGGQYLFTLDHKAAYITFMPYTNQGVVAGAKIQKIRVFTGNTSDALAGTFDLADNGTLSNPTSTSNSVTLTVPNFSIPTTSTYATNGATMVVNPGTYNNVSIEYTLHDPATNVTGTITKTYPSVTFTAGRNKKVKTDLQVKDYSSRVYTSWSSTGASGCPNANECIWYCMQGDPHWDNELWATLGHLYAGGMWFKKKAKISGFTSTNYNGTDYRTTYQIFRNTSITQGKPSNLNDYFYLPTLGAYGIGMLFDAGSIGDYWSSTPDPEDSDFAYYLRFVSGDVRVLHANTPARYQLWSAQ